MKIRFTTVLIVSVILSLLFSYTFINGKRPSIKCSNTIDQEVELMAEFAAMKNSNNLANAVGVVTFKMGDILYGIGHGTPLDKTEKYTAYKINPLLIKRSEDYLGSASYYPYCANEKILGKVLSDTESGMLLSCDEVYEGGYQKIKIADKIVAGDAEIWIRDKNRNLKAYSITVDIVILRGKASLDICVMDEELMEMTNGIIPGMSGSPIVQNGKLIGVLSHAYLDNPREGKAQIIWNIDCIKENIITDN